MTLLGMFKISHAGLTDKTTPKEQSYTARRWQDDLVISFYLRIHWH